MANKVMEDPLCVSRYRFSRCVCHRIAMDGTLLSHSNSNSRSGSPMPPARYNSGRISQEDECNVVAAGIITKGIKSYSKSLSAPMVLQESKSLSSSPSRKQLARLVSWSRYLQPGGDEQAVETAEEWMIDLSKLLVGQKFASGAHSRLYHGIYQAQAVAVKVCRSQDNSLVDSQLLDRLFSREVSLLSKLQHPNVVKLIGACKKPKISCIVTEFVGGGSLKDFLKTRDMQQPELNNDRVFSMALDVARGMAYVHSQGVVHRDIKSDNLLLDDTSKVIKVVDFGVARFETECKAITSDIGTYRWMAPEMVGRKPHNRKVDVYSYGIVLWEMVTGQVPFEGMTPIQAAFAVVNKNARPPIPTDCNPTLRQVMQQCWAPNPEARPEFSEVVRKLEGATSLELHNSITSK